MEFEKDITGYGRKMGMTAGMTSSGKIDNVVKLGDGEYDGMQPAATRSMRTINPGPTESSGVAGNQGESNGSGTSGSSGSSGTSGSLGNAGGSGQSAQSGTSGSSGKTG